MATLRDVLAAHHECDAGPRASSSGSSGTAAAVPRCGHQCRISGRCALALQVRFNQGGTLHVPWGYVGGVAVRPGREETVLPRLPWRPRVQLRHARLRSALRLLPELGHVPGASRSARRRPPPRDATPAALVTRRCARARGSWSSTYNEPLITAEWAVAVFAEASAAGARHRVHLQWQRHASRCSNICGRTSTLQGRSEELQRSAATGSWADASSRSLTPSVAARAGIWIEIVTLLIPGFNDARGGAASPRSPSSSGVSADIPWHVTAFHSDYRMADVADTTADMLTRARDSDARPACATCTPATSRAALAISRTPPAPHVARS